jgi:hypothetical protein
MAVRIGIGTGVGAPKAEDRPSPTIPIASKATQESLRIDLFTGIPRKFSKIYSHLGVVFSWRNLKPHLQNSL